MYQKVSEDLLKFIGECPSCYHVTAQIRSMLLEEGFCELYEEKEWKLQEGGCYFVTRNDSSIIAFKLPTKRFCNFQITASHSDSPCFKVKELPEMKVEGHYVELNVEKYGGMILAPWFDRPLSVAGRVILRQENKIITRLVNVDRDLVMIPNVAIHMERKLNEGYVYNAQKDMIPLFGDETAEGKFLEILEEQLKVTREDILGMDLFLYNRIQGTVWGANREFISSARLDDLQCVYACLQGFLPGEHSENVSVLSVFDNEEVGSRTKQGADSTMLQDTLERICLCCGRSKEEYRMLIASSFMLSADNAHAVHPHHLDKADPVNRPHMNGGVVIKSNANQKYTTDGVSAGIFQEICKNAEVPVQYYVNRSDVAGGSTLGNIVNSHISLNTADIGLAQLAMHSPYETAGVKDTEYLIRAVKAFYDTGIRKTGSGEYLLQPGQTIK